MTKPSAILAGLLATALAGPVAAQSAQPIPPSEAKCAVARDTAFLAGPLPRVAARLAAQGPLKVMVYGTAPTPAMGLGDPSKAYPAQFEAELRRLKPAIAVEVSVRVQRDWLAAEMAKTILAEAVSAKPDLIIWQTGTAEAVQGIDVPRFSEMLGEGLDALRQVGMDVVLITPQYRRRTSSVIDLKSYIDDMERIAGSRDTVLFRRYHVMAQYAAAGIARLDQANREAQMTAAVFVHECIGRLLAAEIIEASRP